MVLRSGIRVVFAESGVVDGVENVETADSKNMFP